MRIARAINATFNEEWNKVYLGMVEVCLELGRYSNAIEYVDHSKARNLVELIATRDVYPGGMIPDIIRQRLQSLKQAIYQEDRRLQDEENPDYTRLSQLRQEKQQLEPYKPLHFQAMQGLLDEETAILEWYILPGQFLTFTLTAESLNLWTSSQEDLKQLGDWGNTSLTAYYQAEEVKQQALEALKATQTEAEQQQAKRLFKEAQDIWQNPLAERMEGLASILHLDEILSNLRQNFPNCQKLILIPHRHLHQFPLHALPVATGEGEGKFLQDLFPKGVTYVPNCQLLQQLQNRQRPDFNRLFAINNPTGDLNWSEIEVEAIRNIFPQRETFSRENARLATFVNKNLSQTHHLFFSGHASFQVASPLDSGLLFADGVLTLEQIITQLNLSNCRLVTLSACETGVTDFTSTGDEYISLASGFLAAGSTNVVCSLWSQTEQSIAILRIRFYETLQQQPNLSVVLALQQSQQWLRETTVQDLVDWINSCPAISPEGREEMEEIMEIYHLNSKPFESPYYWAAFVAIGA